MIRKLFGVPDTNSPSDLKLSFEQACAAVKPGLYRNWKGHYVMVTGMGLNSEDCEPEVEYLELTDRSGSIHNPPMSWHRRISLWLKPVNEVGYKGTRFIRIDAGTMGVMLSRPNFEALREGYVCKGGQNVLPSQITERPPAPEPLRSTD